MTGVTGSARPEPIVNEPPDAAVAEDERPPAVRDIAIFIYVVAADTVLAVSRGIDVAEDKSKIAKMAPVVPAAVPEALGVHLGNG